MTTIKVYYDKDWESTEYIFCDTCYELFFRPNEVVVKNDAAMDATCELCGRANHIGAPPVPLHNH